MTNTSTTVADTQGRVRRQKHIIISVWLQKYRVNAVAIPRAKVNNEHLWTGHGIDKSSSQSETDTRVKKKTDSPTIGSRGKTRNAAASTSPLKTNSTTLKTGET